MEKQEKKSLVEKSRENLRELIRKNDFDDAQISILAKTLTPEEAIGNPKRRDYPIIEGKEKMVEALFLGARGHSFTDSPVDFQGSIREVVDLPLHSNSNRAIYFATLNAVMRKLNLIQGTVHCRDQEPEKCAHCIAEHVMTTWGKLRVGLIGLNPAIAEMLVKTFGTENVLINDLDRKNIGNEKFGVTVGDGRTRTEALIQASDFVLATGTTLGNDTFETIWDLICKHQKKYLFYGVTVAGVSHQMGINRICPYGRD